MAKVNSTFLDVNAPFPEMDIQLVSGETLHLPNDFGNNYTVILFYRGAW